MVEVESLLIYDFIRSILNFNKKTVYILNSIIKNYSKD